MFKKLLILTSIVATSLLFGCSKPVAIDQTSYAVMAYGDSPGADWSNIYNGQNMKLSTICNNYCNKAYLFSMPMISLDYKGSYAITQSSNQELTADFKATFNFNKAGGPAIQERLKYISNNYPSNIIRSGDKNQIIKWNIKDVAELDIPLSKFKSISRQIMNKYEIVSAHAIIASNGSIVEEITEAVTKHLVDINSVLLLTRLEVSNLDLPTEIKEKNANEYNLDANERILDRQLAMKRKRLTEQHLLELSQLANDIELAALVQPTLSSEILQYKWIQTFNHGIDMGIPMALTPEMLNPSISKVLDKTFNMDKVLENIKQRKTQIENDLQKSEGCAETDKGC